MPGLKLSHAEAYGILSMGLLSILNDNHFDFVSGIPAS